MADLTKEQILEGEALPFEPVQVRRLQKDGRESIDTVYVRGLDGYQRSIVNATMVQIKNGGRDMTVNAEAIQRSEAMVCMLALVDKTGKRLFTRQEITNKSIENFSRAWRAGAIETIFNKASALSGMTTKALEDAEGNSEAAPRHSSISA